MTSLIFNRGIVLVAACVAASFAASGCRFGNRVERAPSTEDDPLLGYYETSPQSFTVTAVHGTTDEVAAELTLIPSNITTRFTNPVIMQTVDAGQHLLALANNAGKYAIGLLFDSATQEFGVYADGEDSFWYPECILQEATEIAGKYTFYPSIKRTPEGFPAKGSIGFSYAHLMVFKGDCTQSLAEISDCYNDASLCGFATDEENLKQQTAVRNFFAPYIESHAMTVSDLVNTTSLGYVVQYQ